jgi:anthranilate/para-aminobenzoate synthase component II
MSHNYSWTGPLFANWCAATERVLMAVGRPEDSGISLAVVRELGPSIPLFGVCMGHQCIGEVFGGNVVRAPCGVMHGKASPVHHNNTGLLQVCRLYCVNW